MELLNEILVKVSQLSPGELSILLEAAKGLQCQAAASGGPCIDDNTPEKNGSLLVVEN